MVDPRGFEPLTFWLPARRGSTVCQPGKPQVADKRRRPSYPLNLDIGEPTVSVMDLLVREASSGWPFQH